jgi:hypothetical protein
MRGKANREWSREGREEKRRLEIPFLRNLRVLRATNFSAETKLAT